MPFQILPLRHEDIDGFAQINTAANVDRPRARAMEDPSGTVPRPVFVSRWMRLTWRRDPTDIWIKAVDAETGEMAGAALWKIPRSDAVPRHPGESESGENGEEGMVAVGEGKEGTHYGNDVVKDDPQARGNVQFFADGAEAWAEFEKEFIPEEQRPYAVLAILCTDPKYQRQGVGSMLVTWGCEKADEQGLLCALTASQAGWKVYERCGFKVVRADDVDLRKYGVDAWTVSRRMLRPANPASKPTSA